MRLLAEPRREGKREVADYRWDGDAARAGRILLEAHEGSITRLVITFE